MAITVKHNKVSTIPDTTDTSLVRPSDWNADHTLVGTIDVANGGTGASTLTGYVKGNGTSAMTAVATVPSTDITGLGTMSTQNANAVAITGGTINGTTIGATTASTGRFSDLTDTGLTSGRVVYASTGGNLVDASNFTYDGTNLVAGAIQNTSIGATTPATGKFSTLESTGTGSFGTTSAQYIQAVGNALYPQILAVGSGTNIPLVLQPKGTGALQAQLTDSTTAGGNARGANAVDWQMVRSTASQVASGTYAFIGAGRQGTSSGQDSFVGAGFNNTASTSQSAVVAGARNQATGGSNFIGSGNDNLANLAYGTVVGGQGNQATGYFGFVGNGFTNSTTSSSSVTTQSATMNGTTAVTLSGSNANIKVGQLITGTYITFPTTYVAAISGTSLTLSTVASGSGTATLSFFTPHGVVVGGGNNQATGSYSFIGGGGDAGTAANRNVASGDWSFVGGGTKNVASGAGSVIAGGGLEFSTNYGNTASGTSSFVGGGILNNATAIGCAILSGWQNTANGTLSTVVGGRYGTTRGIAGNIVFPACNEPIGGAGVSQSAVVILGTQTTNATATALRSDANAAGTTNQVILPNNSAYFFTGEVVSGVTGGGNTKGWTIEGVIKRGADAASTALVGTPTVTSMYADLGAATWTIAVTADTTNGGLRVTFTGQASTTIRTVCQIRTTEMTY
jgi:hypothetical protein